MTVDESVSDETTINEFIQCTNTREDIRRTQKVLNDYSMMQSIELTDNETAAAIITSSASSSIDAVVSYVEIS